MTKSNRQYKDSVFVDLFSKDESAKKNFLSLYNALHDTALTIETTDIKPLRLEQVLYHGFYNDVSFLVNGRIIVLLEHQSTINENMPLRFLLYITRLYEKLTDSKSRYAFRQISLPEPEFYVFYNGIDDYPAEKTLHLSDSFANASLKSPLELSVTVYNINRSKHAAILSKCKPLEEFSSFVETVRSAIKVDPENGFTDAIKTCINKGILLEYLKRNNTEVANMLLAEYDYDLDMQVKKEEAMAEAMEIAMEKAMEKAAQIWLERGISQSACKTAKILLSLGDSPEKIAQATGLTLEEIEKISKE